MVILLSVMADDQGSSSSPNKSSSSSIVLSCEDFYAKRVHYLEHFRDQLGTTTSYCLSSSKSVNNNSINETRPWSKKIHNNNNNDSDDGSSFVKLEKDMISLLEKDVQLTKQLLDLNYAIEQLKTCFTIKQAPPTKKVLHNSPSLSSLNSANNEDDEKRNNSINLKEINCFAVNDDADYDDEDVDELFYYDNHQRPPKQYFQRQNSALRIPIMPGKRHRFPTEEFTTSFGQNSRKQSDHHQFVKRKSCPIFEQLRSPLHSPNSDSGCSAESSSNSSNGNTTKGNVVTVGSSVLVCHGSQNSFDSGVHSASPEEREEIFV